MSANWHMVLSFVQSSGTAIENFRDTLEFSKSLSRYDCFNALLSALSSSVGTFPPCNFVPSFVLFFSSMLCGF